MHERPASATRPGNRIKAIREARGLRLAQVAAALLVDQSTVSRWERPQANIPDAQKFALAALLEVDVPHLMGWDTEAQAA